MPIAKYIIIFIAFFLSSHSYGSEEHLQRMNSAPDHIQEKYFYSFNSSDYEEKEDLFGLVIDKALNKAYSLTKSFAPAVKAASFAAKCSGPSQCMESAVQEVFDPQAVSDGTHGGAYVKNKKKRKAFLDLKATEQKRFYSGSQNLKAIFEASEKAIAKDLGPKPKKIKCNKDQTINSFVISKEDGFPAKTRIIFGSYKPETQHIPREILIKSDQGKMSDFILEFNNQGKISRVKNLSKKNSYPSKVMSLDQLKGYIKKKEEDFLKSKDPMKENSLRVYRRNKKLKKLVAWFDKIPTYVQAYHHDMLKGCNSESLKGSNQRASLSDK